LGELIEALKENDLYDNTIIIYSGDNGLALGQHGLMGKQNLYEPSTKVPLIFFGKGIKADTKVNAMVYLTDLYPTICEMLGIEIPRSVDGASFQSLFENPEGTHHDYILTSYRNVQRAIRNDRYKLIKYDVKGEKHTQLFDLANDPNEMENLIDSIQFKAVLDTLETKFKELLVEYNDTVWKE
jgi:arylsulfatase A-like enzyme